MIKAILPDGSTTTSRPKTDKEYDREIQSLLQKGAKLVKTVLPSCIKP